MQPRVLCICPYHLPHFIDRARACFQSQTYQNAEWWEWNTAGVKKTIGFIRNNMIEVRPRTFDLVAHFDHDDWSHPERLAEQVEFLESTGADVVGYSDMAFVGPRNEVTFYRTRARYYAMGTSLLYRRELWEKQPFPEVKNEDAAWLKIIPHGALQKCSSLVDGVPRMVATIHKQNTSKKPKFPQAEPAVRDAVLDLLSLRNSAQLASGR